MTNFELKLFKKKVVASKVQQEKNLYLLMCFQKVNNLKISHKGVNHSLKNQGNPNN